MIPMETKMASAPNLPLFYKGLEPLSGQAHADFRFKPAQSATFLMKEHAIPVTVDEFGLVQRHMPIVFSTGPEPIPLALMGLNEGVNIFLDEEGRFPQVPMYVPAYVRRYPFMLAKLTPNATELSLCFDPTSEMIGQMEDGEAFFVDGQPSELTKNILTFNKMFEEAGMRTANFMRELAEMDLLMDGEVSIQPEGAEQPFIYRGFRMVDEEKLNKLRGDQLRKMVTSGMLPLLYAHLFSLSLMRDLFQTQLARGLMPQPQPELTI